MQSFEFLRERYPEFVYKSYNITCSESSIAVEYEFEITGLTSFKPRWEFPLEKNKKLDKKLLDNMVFSLGLVELISYWKATCSPIVKVLPHGLDAEMISWWKALYFGGLGEFFYRNSIKTDIDSFMTIQTYGDILPSSEPQKLEGNLVPIGGGKDSAVTLRILAPEKEKTLPYIINSRGATDKTCEAAGYSNAYLVKRFLDKNLIELNSQGFLNGHTPFSAIVAFSSLISASICGKKYVVLSNESSANESTVLGEDVNHQFSKGILFEKNFIDYQKKYINSGVEYFSLLRPLSEMQIAALFSKYKEYHNVFRSCNVGSKKDVWCCDCPKCLFVYIILSPFLKTEELEGIFGENLLNKESLIETYKELIGILPNKPFECVGSRDEVITASLYTLCRMEENGEDVPLLLQYFKSLSIKASTDMKCFMSFYDNDNFLPENFKNLLTKELGENINA